MELPINVLAEILTSLEVDNIKNLIKNDRGWQNAFNFIVIHNMCICAYSDSPITHDIFLSEEICKFDFYPLEFENTQDVEGTLYLNLEILNQKHNWNNIIPDRFLEDHKFKNIILEKGQNITQIKSFFLSECLSLTEIDLESLSNITQIYFCFLYGCQGLIHVNLAPLSNITHVGNFFLYGCPMLISAKIPKNNKNLFKLQ